MFILRIFLTVGFHYFSHSSETLATQVDFFVQFLLNYFAYLKKKKKKKKASVVSFAISIGRFVPALLALCRVRYFV